MNSCTSNLTQTTACRCCNFLTRTNNILNLTKRHSSCAVRCTRNLFRHTSLGKGRNCKSCSTVVVADVTRWCQINSSNNSWAFWKLGWRFSALEHGGLSPHKLVSGSYSPYIPLYPPECQLLLRLSKASFLIPYKTCKARIVFRGTDLNKLSFNSIVKPLAKGQSVLPGCAKFLWYAVRQCWSVDARSRARITLLCPADCMPVWGGRGPRLNRRKS